MLREREKRREKKKHTRKKFSLCSRRRAPKALLVFFRGSLPQTVFEVTAPGRAAPPPRLGPSVAAVAGSVEEAFQGWRRVSPGPPRDAFLFSLLSLYERAYHMTAFVRACVCVCARACARVCVYKLLTELKHPLAAPTCYIHTLLPDSTTKRHFRNVTATHALSTDMT